MATKSKKVGMTVKITPAKKGKGSLSIGGKKIDLTGQQKEGRALRSDSKGLFTLKMDLQIEEQKFPFLKHSYYKREWWGGITLCLGYKHRKGKKKGKIGKDISQISEANLKSFIQTGDKILKKKTGAVAIGQIAFTLKQFKEMISAAKQTLAAKKPKIKFNKEKLNEHHDSRKGSLLPK